MNNAPAGWEHILDEGEEIRWQGRPDGAVVWKVANFATLLFGAAFSGFALFWMIMAAAAGGGFWMFGLLHFFVGIGIGIGPVFWGALRRRKSWYTLTNRRAIIATDMPFKGRVLRSYPILTNTVLEIDTNDPASVIFASEQRRRKNGTYKVKIGFERIVDAKQVYALLRGIQKEAA